MINKIIRVCVLLIAVSFNVTANHNLTSTSEKNTQQRINEVLDSFHQAAGQADATRYLALLTPNAVFLGTDASERWNKAQFSEFVTPHFTRGDGWLYQSVERNITLLANADVAYFDELLTNDSYGLCRGSGVLMKTSNGWKIAQYSLSVPLPNPIAKQLIEQIKVFKGKENE
ncbi:nuclear transport factor 2 family protein [Colwellia sp. D2M02]|uniref:nuclear transport factor 2 family protein n=1 Tax=Colwellia sp. D2M02 TaxID=2841562 RepID=UPI00209136C3|nr:nuclear transport factor 2 family protein [Colwellia sp. D2M02]